VLNARLNRIAQSETSGLILIDIPVIALTADAMDSDIKKALDIRSKDYITKPIDVPKFLTMIDEF